mmetsp:Transcript_19008/g.48341  ORF Transcript_19008/g.48341 Transcript_19008/m.48341 type:complete len:605 (-) Transcript_19008:112-1926(-)
MASSGPEDNKPKTPRSSALLRVKSSKKIPLKRFGSQMNLQNECDEAFDYVMRQLKAGIQIKEGSDGVQRFQGGTFKQLLTWVILQLDTEYSEAMSNDSVKAFLLTYRQFCTSDELFSHLESIHKEWQLESVDKDDTGKAPNSGKLPPKQLQVVGSRPRSDSLPMLPGLSSRPHIVGSSKLSPANPIHRKRTLSVAEPGSEHSAGSPAGSPAGSSALKIPSEVYNTQSEASEEDCDVSSSQGTPIVPPLAVPTQSSDASPPTSPSSGRNTPRFKVNLPKLNLVKVESTIGKTQNCKNKFSTFLRCWAENWWALDFQDKPLGKKYLAFVFEKYPNLSNSIKLLMLKAAKPKDEKKRTYSITKAPTTMSLVDIPSNDIADQLTLIEAEMFTVVSPVEFIEHSWRKKSDDDPPSKITNNLGLIAERFNQVSFWVATSIVKASPQKQQLKFVKKFIKVSKRMLTLRNYNGLMAVLSGLNLSSVQRLPVMKEGLSKSQRDDLQKLEALMSPQHNFKAYRSLDHTPPMIPYLAMYLRDLTFVNDGNKDYLEENATIINFEKMMLFAERIYSWLDFTYVPYALTSKDNIRNVLSNITWLDEEALHKCSKSQT